MLPKAEKKRRARCGSIERRTFQANPNEYCSGMFASVWVPLVPFRFRYGSAQARFRCSVPFRGFFRTPDGGTKPVSSWRTIR